MSLDDMMACPCCGRRLDVPRRGRGERRAERVAAVRVMRLAGMTVREVASALGLSASQAHHWVEEARKADGWGGEREISGKNP